MAACRALGPSSLAIDNQGTVDFIHGVTRRGHEGARQLARGRHGAANVRAAIERIIHHKGPGAVAVLKVKSHIDPGDPMADIIAPRHIRAGNMRADEATSRGMATHQAEGLCMLTPIPRMLLGNPVG